MNRTTRNIFFIDFLSIFLFFIIIYYLFNYNTRFEFYSSLFFLILFLTLISCRLFKKEKNSSKRNYNHFLKWYKNNWIVIGLLYLVLIYLTLRDLLFKTEGMIFLLIFGLFGLVATFKKHSFIIDSIDYRSPYFFGFKISEQEIKKIYYIFLTFLIIFSIIGLFVFFFV